MPFRPWLSRAALILIVVAVAAAIALVLIPDVRSTIASAFATMEGGSSPDTAPRHPAETGLAGAASIPGRSDALSLPEAVVRAMGIRTVSAGPPSRPQRLEMIGTLAIDPNHLAHVHTRFTGEVVELGTVEDPATETDGGHPSRRPIRYGDRVEKDQLLAVLWSTELGEKKSEYVDALSKLRLERETLTRLEALYRDDATPERNVREARRNVEGAEIAVERSERTLRAFRLGEREISAIRAEVDALRREKSGRDGEVERDWARVELRSPFLGTVLEKNLAVGDIVDTASDLFKVADLGQLAIWTHVYEDDLPTLLSLAMPIPWAVRLKSAPEGILRSGAIETIGSIIDPIQHTVPVMGRVENPDGRLRAGEFVVATVDLPPPPGVVEVPIDALVEDGRESVVIVQPGRSLPEYELRGVRVVRRFEDRAYVRADARTPGATLREGDLVVVSGAVELRAALRPQSGGEAGRNPAGASGESSREPGEGS